MVFRSDAERKAFDCIAEKDEFDYRDLETQGFAPKAIAALLVRWEKAGLIRQVRRDGAIFVYRAAGKAINPDSAVLAAKTAEEAAWTVIRRTRRFTPSHVFEHVKAAGIDVSLEKVRSYCRQLLDAGYLRVVQKARPGKREAGYVLIRDPGEKPVRRVRVYGLLDENSGAFFPGEGTRS